MEPEPTTTSAALPTASADADADMSIDYGAGGDAAMEEDVPKEGEITVEEAEMADDEASGWEKEATAADAMLEEDQPFQTEAVSAAPFEVPISVDDRPLPLDFAQPPSCSAPQDPPLAPAPTEIGLAPAGADEPVVSSLPFSTDEPPSAVGGVDAPLEEALAGPELSSLIPPVEVPVDEAASRVDVPALAGEEGISIEVAAEPTPSVDAASAATDAREAVDPPAMTASEANALEYKSGAASAAAEVEAVPSAGADLVEAAAPEPAAALGSRSSDSSSRPLVDKDPLLSIEVPAHPPAESSPSSRGVPAVFLSFDNTTYSLFHSHRLLTDDDEDSPAAGNDQEDLPLLLSTAEQHDLYYQPVETLFRVVREHFPELKDQQDELVLEFDEIGIALGEDNVYSRQVTLFDFDRIHLGCQLPGRLHARLSSQGRFASGFNALAQHIANSYSADGVDGEEEGDESVTAAGDEEEEGEEIEFEVLEEGEEGEEGSVGERPADDHDGPDSEYVHVGEDEEEGAGGEGEPQSEESQEQGGGEGEEEERGEDDFDLEQALAQLDGDDVVAVVEGVQEDYLLSENSARPEEGGVVEGQVQENGEGEAPGEAAVEGEPTEEKEEEAVAPVGGEEPSAAEATTDDLPPTSDAPQESVGETDLAQAAEEEGQLGPGAKDESPTPPLGEDALAAQVPVPDPATTEENGTDAAETVEPVVEDAVDSACESAGTTGEVLDATAETALATEEPADSTDDVIIDYDEAFDGSTSNRADVQAQPPTAPRSAAGPTAAPITTALNGQNGEDGDVEEVEEGKNGVVDEGALLSPKRSRESFLDGQEEVEAGDDVTAGEAKRPRLTDPAAVSSA